MSEVDTHITATLLPQASVAVYSKDSNTIDAAKLIAGDWRFARVSVQAAQGDVESAISFYAEHKSPDIVIVQTDVINDAFVGRLEALAGHCDEGTEAVVIGPDNDVYLYRKLIDMGVSDYLVRPVSQEILSEVIAKTLIHQHGVSGSRLIAFVGAKGGVGTSTIMRQLGWTISGLYQQKTLLLDVSGGWSAHPVGIGYEPTTTFAEAVKAAEKGDQDSLARMMYRASDKLSVMATGGDSMLEPICTLPKLEKLIEVLMIKNPVVLADLSCTAPDTKKLLLARAQQIVLVSDASVGCLRLARSLAHEIKGMRGGNITDIELLINKQGMAPVSEVAKADIEAAMEMKVSTILPFDPKLFVSMESEAVSILQNKQAKPLLDNIFVPFVKNNLDISGYDVPSNDSEDGKNKLSGLLGKLGKK